MLRLDGRPSSCGTAITLVAAALLGIGVVMVFSASASLTAPPISENILQNQSFRQTLFTLLALVVLLVVALCPYRWWRIRHGRAFQPAILLMFLAVGLLVAVLLFGEERNGAKRWLSLGPIAGGLSFQPSEVAKLAIVVFFAAFCSRIGEGIRRFWSGLLPAILILLLVVGLVGWEDLGTGALLLAVGGGILLAGGARVWHLCVVSLPAVWGLGYLVWSQPYRMERIFAFLYPEADPQGTGYQGIQSLITIASGGWWGRGLGQGIQKYDYLPEARSDFVFSVVCEELGIIGGAAVILLFVVLVWQGRRAMAGAPTEFGRLLAFGATLTIGLQAAMNIAVVTVSMPTKGIGLPLVSAGGTGVVLFSILVGLLANVARERRVSADVRGPASLRQQAACRADKEDGGAAHLQPVTPTAAR
ncbi:MAG: cell division protein FtsW [Phycisphaerae bacterium]|nr:cell division protein FtsW [Phycisphaerae bacterium]